MVFGCLPYGGYCYICSALQIPILTHTNINQRMKKITYSIIFLCCFGAGLNAQSTFASHSANYHESAPSLKRLASTPPAKPFYESEYDDYGGKIGVGVSIFNGFLVPVRYYANPKNVFEASVGLGGVVIYTTDNEPESIQTGFLLGGGYTFFNDRFLKEKKKRNKVRAHGLAIRASHLLGDFNSSFASLGWAMETFKENRRNNSFIFELGLQALFPNFVYEGQEFNKVRPGIYLRCHWNFFLK